MEIFPPTNYLGSGEIVLRMALASALGFVVGFDRAVKNKPLGFRPFMLVALGLATLAMITMEVALQPLAVEERIRIDVSRVIQGVVGGIGFLGAGAIIHGQNGVRGSSTGAGIWVVGAIGLAVGFGFYVYALLAAAFAVIVYVVFGPFSAKLDEAARETNKDD